VDARFAGHARERLLNGRRAVAEHLREGHSHLLVTHEREVFGQEHELGAAGLRLGDDARGRREVFGDIRLARELCRRDEQAANDGRSGGSCHAPRPSLAFACPFGMRPPRPKLVVDREMGTA
jgi:hypothetical protein